MKTRYIAGKKMGAELEYLRYHGLFGPDNIFNHCASLSKRGREILRDAGVKANACPRSMHMGRASAWTLVQRRYVHDGARRLLSPAHGRADISVIITPPNRSSLTSCWSLQRSPALPAPGSITARVA